MSDNSNDNTSETARSSDKKDNGTFDVSAQIEDLQKQAEKYKNDFLYLKAEFENYKRNAIKERSDFLKYGCERLATEVLGVLDNFERAISLKVNETNLPTFVKGIEMTAQELRNALTKFGVSEVVSDGAPFDPAMHEALSSEETSEVPEGHVLRVFKKPYKLYDKVIRPGQVVVARKPTEN